MKIEQPLDGSAATRVRDASDVLFKSRFLLEMLLVIAQEECFYHGQILELVPRIGGSFVTNVLKRYEAGGLIRRLSEDPGQSRQHFEKQDPDLPLWVWIPDLVRYLANGPAGSVAQLVRN
jgi:hypothetical protein